MRRWRGTTLTALLVLAAYIPCLAAGPWRTVRPAGERRTLPAGKTLARHPSPDRRYVLLVRDEGEQGDFVWRSVYLQHGRSYTLLHTCNSLRRARWSRSPTRVRFEMEVATAPDEIERSEVVYTPATRSLRKRLLRTIRVEGAG